MNNASLEFLLGRCKVPKPTEPTAPLQQRDPSQRPLNPLSREELGITSPVPAEDEQAAGSGDGGPIANRRKATKSMSDVPLDPLPIARIKTTTLDEGIENVGGGGDGGGGDDGGNEAESPSRGKRVWI